MKWENRKLCIEFGKYFCCWN